MLKKIIFILPVCLLSFSFSHAESITKNVEVSSTVEKSCVIKLPNVFNFGIISFSDPSFAPNFPANFAAFKEMPFNLSIRCSPNVIVNINYSTEKDVSPSGTNIEGIKMTNPNSTVQNDRFNAFIFNTATKTMVHSLAAPLVLVGDGEWYNYNTLFLAIQNPFARGYISPVAGVYTGTSDLRIDF